MISRRTFLGSLLSVPQAKSIPLGVLAAVLSPTRSRAEPVTVAIGVASAVAGLIASANRGDGGLSAYLSALSEKMDVAIGQLASLQSAVSTVLLSLSSLPGEIDAMLRDRDISNLHDETFAVVKSYTNLIRVREQNYASDNDFLAVRAYREELQGLIQRLDTATSLLEAKKSYGPTTALIAPSVFMLQNSLLNFRGDPPGDIAVRLSASMDWLNRIVDPQIQESTASYRGAAVSRHEQIFQAAAESEFGKIFGMQPGNGLLACAGIDDYQAPYTIHRMCMEVTENRSVENTLPVPVAFNASYRTALPQRVPCPESIPERIGPRERMFENVSLSEAPYVAKFVLNGSEMERDAGFLAYAVSRLGRSEIVAHGDGRVPPNCDVWTTNEPNPARRIDLLTSALDQSPRNRELENFQNLLDGINLERARISYATSALTVVAQARTQLSMLINDLER